MLEYFTDPVLRAPTLGSMLMCFVAGIVGVIVFLRKESLLGEALSHATYPGVILGVIFFSFIDEKRESFLSLGILVGAFVTALLGLVLIRLLREKFKVPADAALCFILSIFFGIGLTLASRVQFTHSVLYQQVQTYLYGQAATMTDTHIIIYLILSFVVLGLILAIYKELQVITLDRQYAKSLGIRVQLIDASVFVLIVLAVIIGIRSVGVVLISAMLIAPAAAARQFTNRLSTMFILSATFGLTSGFLGNVLSVNISNTYRGEISLPTGPMIVLVAACICLISLFLAPERGLLIRLGRIFLFRYKRLRENILKGMWYHPKGAVVTTKEIQKYLNFPNFILLLAYRHLIHSGWVMKVTGGYQLTDDGYHRAAHIVRLHRLWEVYLVNYLGVGAERVHCDAEEMEHIITPKLEKQLTQLLNDPRQDPHDKPIPSIEEISGY